jgi:hypothetical protein
MSTDLYLFDDSTIKARGCAYWRTRRHQRAGQRGTDGGRRSKPTGESNGAGEGQHARGQASGGLTMGGRRGINIKR